MRSDLKAGQVIIHFGMDKTGSSSLRSSLSKHLKDPRFFYLTLGISNASRSLAAAFKENPASFPYFKNSGLSAGELQRLRAEAIENLGAELDKSAGRTVIMSAEAVANFREPELRNLWRFVDARAGTVTAAGYIRRPKEYMESIFQQQIKGHFSGELAPDRLLMDYRSRFEKFDAVFGSRNVKLWLFDPKSFPGGCVVQDFCARLGIRFQVSKVIRTNDGLSRPALSLLFAYRKFGAGYTPGASLVRENALLTKQLRELDGPKLRLHSSVVAPVIEGKRDGISWMEARLGASLAEDLAAHDEVAIRTEADLLKFSPESLRWLAEQLGPDYVARWHPGMTPQEVAEWVGALRLMLASRDGKLQEAKAGPPEARGVSANRPRESGGPMNRRESLPAAMRPESRQEAPPKEGAETGSRRNGAAPKRISNNEPARSVIWIASYPKSGNTWIQAVVRRAGGKSFGFPGKDLDVYYLIAEKRLPAVVGRVRPDVSGPATTVLKTHDRFTPGRGLHRQLQLKTAGFVHVMRNPLDMLLSYVNFTRMQYEKRRESPQYRETLFIDLLGFDRAIPYEEWVKMKLEDIPRSNLDHALMRFMELKTAIPGVHGASGSWLDHCFSWFEAGKALPCAFLRYEDLLKGPEQFLPLRKLFSFSETEIVDAVNKIIQSTRAKHGDSIFFNKMSAYYYPQFFSATAVSLFLERFRSELRALGYGDLPGLA